MSNQENGTFAGYMDSYRITIKYSRIAAALAFMIFAVTAIASIAYGSEQMVLSEVIDTYHGLIGTLLFGALSITAIMVTRGIPRHSSDYKFFLVIKVLCFMIFGAFIYITPTNDLVEWYRTNREVATSVAVGFGVLAFSFLAHTAAHYAKAKAEQRR